MPTPFQLGESVWAMPCHADGLTLVALSSPDIGDIAEAILYRVSLPAGSASPTRASLGCSFLERPIVAFDDASAYFTLERSNPLDNNNLETRTLDRACLDGSAETPLRVAACWGVSRCSSSP